jgi:RNA polymerase sigma-70 factor (ECF subfamily)
MKRSGNVHQEGQWISATLRGDQQAFARLVAAYQGPVYNLCYRMLGGRAEAEDAAQETFLRVYTRLGSYDPQRKLSSWILAVASHHCIDHLRRRRAKLVSMEELLPWQPQVRSSEQPEQLAVDGEAQAEIRELLDGLPDKDRLVVILRYWQDLSYSEIATITGATESAVKSRLHRARVALSQRVLQRAQEREEQVCCRARAERRKLSNAVL